MDYALYTFYREERDPRMINDRYTRYHWARRRLEYIFRLMFAVTLDEVYTSGNYRLDLVDKIFSNLTTGTIGELWHVAVKYLIPRLPSGTQLLFRQIWGSDVSSWLVTEYENCCYSTGMLGLKEQRNLDAHPAISPDSLGDYLGQLYQRLLQIQAMTDGKYFCLDERGKYEHSFVLIDKAADQNSSDEVSGYTYSYTGMWSTQIIYRRELQRCNDQIGGQLYLKISRKDELHTEYVRLSPFICFDDYILSIYMGLSAQFSNCVQTVQIPIDSRETHEGKRLVDCTLRSLVPQLFQQDGYYSFPAANNHHIQVNLSRYPEFEKLKDASFPYCAEICDVVQGVEQFCQIDMPGAAYRTIYGDGGVGKTTLVFHLIHDIILRGKSQFDRVIFLSAKNYFRKESKDRTVPICGQEITPDFSSYGELLDRLYRLMCKYPSKAETPDTIERTETELLNKINGTGYGAMPKTILILDDLDTLTEPDQRSVRRFLSKTSGKWVKTLVTTRSHKYVTEQDFPIQLLDQQQSMEFLRWCIRQHCPDFTEESFQAQDPEIVHSYTEGRPIDLCAWASLIVRGFKAPTLFSRYLLPREKTKYLYRTVMQNLRPFDQTLFRLLCAINEAACTQEQLDRNYRAGIPVRLIQYLLPEQTISKATFSPLIEFKLVARNQNALPSDAEYCLRDFCYLDILGNEVCEGLPGYLQDILMYMKKDGNWLPDRYIDRLTLIICTMLGNLGDSESEEKQMIHCIARCMLSEEQRDSLTEFQIERLQQYISGETNPAESTFTQQCHMLRRQIQAISESTSKNEIEAIYRTIAVLHSQAKTDQEIQLLKELLLLYHQRAG